MISALDKSGWVPECPNPGSSRSASWREESEPMEARSGRARQAERAAPEGSRGVGVLHSTWEIGERCRGGPDGGKGAPE